DYAVSSERVLRSGISATRWLLDERLPPGAVPPQEGAPHAGAPPAGAQSHPPHRHVTQIERLIARSALAPASRDRAIALVHRLAAPEAEDHHNPAENGPHH